MVLTRVISIKNVGRFRNSAHTPNPPLAKFTLIYGANGYGKTTLCSVLRSIESGDTAPLVGRKTLGSTTPQEIDLLFADGPKRLRGNAWSDTAPNISVFDGVFIAQNVHSGDVVDIAHKRNLYRVIVGREGVGLAEEEQALGRTGSRHPNRTHFRRTRRPGACSARDAPARLLESASAS
jgi:wobble nucleotide-excising tRNase